MPRDHSSCCWHMRSDTGWRSPTLCAVCAYIWSRSTAGLRSATVSPQGSSLPRRCCGASNSNRDVKTRPLSFFFPPF